VESGEEWYRTPNGTGPYKLVEWTRFEHQVYEANRDFYLGAPSIPYIVVKLYAGEGQRLYESGEIDITGVYSVERFTDPTEPLHSELLTGVDLCTHYVVFDTTLPPFDDVNVRKAFSEYIRQDCPGSISLSRDCRMILLRHGNCLPNPGMAGRRDCLPLFSATSASAAISART
jgi:ABC-type transport system substrate-binding protein